MNFDKIAPYLKDPLVLIGFFVFLGFLFARYLLKRGIIPPLTRNLGYRVLQQILLYGFIFGVLIIILGFWSKSRELSVADQKRSISLLRTELDGNIKVADELLKNSITLLGIFDTVARSVRHEGIPVLKILFPEANIDTDAKDQPSLQMADSAMEQLDQSGLLENDLEVRKASASSIAIAGTIDRTYVTIQSLADTNHSRYRFREEAWKAQLPILRRVSIVDVDKLQESYVELQQTRSNYDVVVTNIANYLIAMREFLDPEDRVVNRQSMAKILAAERLAFLTVIKYSKGLESSIKNLKAIHRDLHEVSSQLSLHMQQSIVLGRVIS